MKLLPVATTNSKSLWYNTRQDFSAIKSFFLLNAISHSKVQFHTDCLRVRFNNDFKEYVKNI